MQGLVATAPALGTKVREIDDEVRHVTIGGLTRLMPDGRRPRSTADRSEPR